METENTNKPEISQPPLNTSFLGVVAAAMDYFGISLPHPELYVYSGHAFVINIHEEVCPSGPYCWDQTEILRLLKNIGLEMTPLDSKYPMGTARHREDLIEQAKDLMDGGCLISVLWLDHQIVKSYDGETFQLAEPWGSMEATRASLSSDSWKGLDGPPVCLYSLQKCERRDSQDCLRQGLDFAIDLNEHSSRFEWDGYRIGSGAFENWIHALDVDNFETHGHWWNATVWAENREMASDFFANAANGDSNVAKLAERFREVATQLAAAVNVDSIEAKKANVEAAFQAEMDSIKLLKQL